MSMTYPQAKGKQGRKQARRNIERKKERKNSNSWVSEVWQMREDRKNPGDSGGKKQQAKRISRNSGNRQSTCCLFDQSRMTQSKGYGGGEIPSVAAHVTTRPSVAATAPLTAVLGPVTYIRQRQSNYILLFRSFSEFYLPSWPQLKHSFSLGRLPPFLAHSTTRSYHTVRFQQIFPHLRIG